ncbi:MAG: subclass B3 metallo-beta-lactamase [Ferruginibacter sp.]
MQQHPVKAVILITALLFQTIFVTAQQVKEPKLTDPEWAQNYQPYRIAGNLYYVGTYDLASYLIVTAKGHILINTGLASSEKQILDNIAALGFKYSDIKILLTTQAHYDHLGAMAAIKKKTKAEFWANAPEAAVLKTGGDSDYAFGGEGPSFKPVKADKFLKNGDSISLGGTTLVMLSHPGHTQGSCSYIFTTSDSARSYRVLIANMPTIVTSQHFDKIALYPNIARDYAHTLKDLRLQQFDIWVASHAGQFSMHEKHKPGDAYNPVAFAGRTGFDASLDELQKDYDDKLKSDAAGNK